MCRNIILLILFAFTISSCDKDGEIRKRLASRKTTEIIVGAREAGETGDKNTCRYCCMILEIHLRVPR